MTWILLLAGVMAIFGILGYLRGTRAALVILVSALLGLLVIGPLGDTVVRYINAFAKGFAFLTSGGMAALSGSGSADAALQSLQGATPLVQDAADRVVVLGMLYVIIVLLGVAFSAIPWFRGTRSFWGLFLGLVAGYLVGGVLVRVLWPRYSGFVPLPFVPEPQVVPVADIGASPGIGGQVTLWMTALASSSLMPFIIAITIVVFILAATRAGNRSTKG